MPLVRVNERLACTAIKIPPPYGSNAEPVLGMSCKKVPCKSGCSTRTEDMTALDLINAVAPTMVTLTPNGRRVTRYTNPPFTISKEGE